MTRSPYVIEIASWGIIFAVIWSLNGIVCTFYLYEYINYHTPAKELSPELLLLLIKTLSPWFLIGYICGILSLFRYLFLLNRFGSLHRYQIHLFKMLRVAIIFGAIIGGIIYPMFALPEGIILKSFFQRVFICALAGNVSTFIALTAIVDFLYKRK